MVSYFASRGGLSQVSSGSGAPSSTPSQVGNLYVDTVGKRAYISVGTSSSADWSELMIT